MKQRAALARALIAEPHYLLMDEPFASLDAQTREFMQIELMKIWQHHKSIVVFVTHSVDEAVVLSDQIVLLRPRPGAGRRNARRRPAASALGLRRARAARVRRAAPPSVGTHQGYGRRRSAIGILHARRQDRRHEGRRGVKVQTAQGRNGVVATGHDLATQAALGVLKDGGNAADAAVVSALVLAVVCPYATTLGGDVYALVYDRSGKISGLNGTGCSPAATDAERFKDGVPGNGPLAATRAGFAARPCRSQRDIRHAAISRR